MIVQHRLIGNIPGRGHGAPLLSPAFPLDSALTTSTVYRAPDPGYIPAQAGRISDDGRYHVHLTTFEIQSTHFGRPVLISANVFRPANTTVRPIIYMNTVSITEEDGAPVSNLSVESLLSFDRFITPAHFASLNAMSQSLHADTWTPALPPMRNPFFAPHSAAHRALLRYYWEAASSRMFGSNAQVFSICLGPQTSCEAIIENAKALLLCDILPYLPAAVRSIPSMSACVLESSVRTLFKDSALAVIFPTAASDPQQPTFDLRRKDGYPSLTELEDRFICAVLDGSCAFMSNMLKRYMSISMGRDASTASFAADYDFSLLLYQLERTLLGGEALIPPEKLIAAWKMLNSLLVNRHRLTDEQVNVLLEDVESRLFSQLSGIPSALEAISTEDLPALWHKALTVSDALFPAFADAIAFSPAADFFLNILQSTLRLDSRKTARTASLITKICDARYTKKPFSAAQVAQLTAEPLISLLQEHSELCTALGEGLRRSNAIFADNQLLTLPLSCLLLDGKQALYDALTVLHEQFISTLPSAAQISGLASVYQRLADERISGHLCDYFAACLPMQLSNLAPLCAMIAAIVPETDDVVSALLRSAQTHGILLDDKQTNTLFELLLPKCARPKEIGSPYADYERAMTAAVNEDCESRLRRLCRCSDVLTRISYDASEASAAILNSCSAEDILITTLQAEDLFSKLWPIWQNRPVVFDALRRYIAAICERDPLRFFVDAASYNSIAILMMHLKNDNADFVCSILAAATQADPCAPISQIDTFFRIFLPYCADLCEIQQQLVCYINASIDCAKDSSDDLFPWLCSMNALAMHYRLLSAFYSFELTHITVRYLCSRCSARCCSPADDAFRWLKRFAETSPDAFEQVSSDIRSLYDILIQESAGEQTNAQAAQLLGHFASTADYPSLCELNKRVACSIFCEALTKDSYSNAFCTAAQEMKRSGMSEEELLARTQQEARAALDRHFSTYRKISEFESAYSSADSPRDRLYNAVLKEHFVRLRDAHLDKPLSLEQMDRLNTVSSQFGIGTSDLPQLIRRISETICQPIYDGSTFSACMDILQSNQIDPPSISKELTGLLKDSIPHLICPQNIHAAMLCSLSKNAKKVNWKTAFALLGMPVPEKLPKPFSPQGQVWLAFIHAVLRSLDLLEQYPGCSYGRQLLDYLCRGDFADFTESLVTANPKRLAAIYPEHSNRSPLLGRWLSR